MSEKFLTFEEVRKKIEEYVKIALKIEDFDITYAKILLNEWHVNIEYKKPKDSLYTTTALFSLNAKTGEVLSFEKNKVWTW